MTNMDIGTMLAETGLPVYYDHGRVGTEAPYITYTTTTNNVFADDKVYQKVTAVRAVLYAQTKRPDLEELIEGVLNAHSIPWNRDEVFDSGSEIFQEIYESEVL